MVRASLVRVLVPITKFVLRIVFPLVDTVEFINISFKVLGVTLQFESHSLLTRGILDNFFGWPFFLLLLSDYRDPVFC